jgi:hypothetical protein
MKDWRWNRLSYSRICVAEGEVDERLGAAKWRFAWGWL